jgi:hypothetical protein
MFSDVMIFSVPLTPKETQLGVAKLQAKQESSDL